MATPADVLTQIAAQVEALTGATRLADDYTIEFSDVARGSTVYQLQGFPNGAAGIDSNQKITVMSVSIALTHVLGVGASERGFTEGSMQTWLATIADRTWWEGAAAIQTVLGDLDDFQTSVSREADAITASVTAQVAVSPT